MPMQSRLPYLSPILEDGNIVNKLPLNKPLDVALATWNFNWAQICCFSLHYWCMDVIGFTRLTYTDIGKSPLQFSVRASDIAVAAKIEICSKNMFSYF